MTKLIYWLGAIAVFAFYGFSEHAVPATSEAMHIPAPVVEIVSDAEIEAAYMETYRYVTDDQLGMGNICIEINDKECEAYR